MIAKETPVRRGRCLCGAVTYEVNGAPVVVARCHCVDCQRGSGAGHSTGAMFQVDKFRVAGEVAEFNLASDKGNQVTRAFCPRCGSPIYGRNSAMTGFVTVALGTLEDSDQLMPQVAVFARSKKPWDILDETIPTFDAQPDWKPEDGL